MLFEPLCVARHVPGNVFDAVVWREELIEVEHSRVELFTQNLLVFPFFTFLQHKRDTYHTHNLSPLIKELQKAYLLRTADVTITISFQAA